MRDFIRAGLTAIMWIAYTLMGIGLFVMGVEASDFFLFFVAFGIGLVLTVVFMMATLWLQRSRTPPAAVQQPATTARAAEEYRYEMDDLPRKSKRTQADRAARLVEALDEDEIADLEALLLERWQADQ